MIDRREPEGDQWINRESPKARKPESLISPP